MEATWLWAIPALPLGGATVNGLIALFRRWTPGDPLSGAHHEGPAGADALPPPEPAAPVAAATRIRLPGEKRRETPKPATAPVHHDPHPADHGHPDLRYAGWIATAAMLAAFAVSVFAFVQLLGLESDQRTLTVDLFSWIRAGSVDIHAALVVDPLSALMILIITGVGTLIHVYSLGYMSHDENPDRYFTYLNLFAGMMLILVLGDSLPLLFVGWEGVGLCSYLLIGFWYTDVAKAQAGKKAFLVNRVGDFGFLLGMFTLFAAAPNAAEATGAGTLSFVTLHHTFAMLPPAVITLACLLLFVGACGKSAQFPLYIWLPDAMAGPTPVSALIHAATMVTAGVYMIARLSFLFSISTEACMVIATVGAFTALFAATMGFVQNDVKKVLAYSTVSQLGFMVLAVGSGGYGAGVYHLMTHAFFKALLFLGSGSLIHAMEHALPAGSDPNDIRSMGGLRKKMPITFWTFTAGWLAICGIPGTSGFFSKDEILAATLHSPILPPALGATLFVAGLLAAGCTAFYMTRLYLLVFFGAPRMGAEAETKVHESAGAMTMPMVLLAILSIVGGVLWMPIFGVTTLEKWLEPALAVLEPLEVHGFAAFAPMLLATLAAFAGLGVAYRMYVDQPALPARMATWMRGTPYRVLWGKYWVDETVESALVQPAYAASRSFLWRGIDINVIDGFVNGTGRATSAAAGAVSRLQTGLVQNYAVSITLGVAAIAIYLLTRLYA